MSIAQAQCKELRAGVKVTLIPSLSLHQVKTTMEEQLASLTGSLSQVKKTLLPLISLGKAGSLSNDHRGIYDSLLSSKHDIVDAIVMINECLWQSGSENTANQGQIVLAPRFMRGSVSLDLAIISHIRTMRNTMTSLDDEFDRLSDSAEEDVSDAFLSLDDQNFRVSWLRPRSLHEANSNGMTFHGAQLQLAANQHWEEESVDLVAVQEGDLVLFHNLSNNTFHNHGLWLEGRVVRIFHEEQKLQVFALEGNFYTVVPCDLRSVTALPKKKSQQQLPVAINAQPSSSAFKSHLEEEEDDERDDITTLPTYFSYAAQQQEQLLQDNIGSWERHTKGIGSKLLAKMGYKRSARQGLGREGQGVAVPVQAMLKPLPKGLGLDFINQQRSKDDPMHPSLDSDRLRREIVSSFNNRPLVGHSNKKHKPSHHSSDGYEQSSSRSVFNFINKVEAKPASSTMAMQPSIAKSGNKPTASSQKSNTSNCSNNSLKKIF